MHLTFRKTRIEFLPGPLRMLSCTARKQLSTCVRSWAPWHYARMYHNSDMLTGLLCSHTHRHGSTTGAASR
jgi:hypothetical protein